MEFVSSKVIKGVEIAGGKIVSSYFINKISGKRMDIDGIEFGISYFVKDTIFRKKAFFDSNDATLINENSLGLEFVITHGGIDWNILVSYNDDEKSGVLRKKITLKVSDPEVEIDYIQLDGFDVANAEFVWSIPKVEKRVFIPAYITTMGQPYYVSDMFFGGEFPVADNRIENGKTYSKYYIGRKFKEIADNGAYESIPFVIGSGSKANFHTLRSEFFEYIFTISAQPAKFRMQFNSWYDNMLDINSEKIAESFRAISDGFSQAGLRPLDCYVVDDGWTDYTIPKFWTFDNNKFADGFEKENQLTKELNSTFGVWFGPRGGYTRQTYKYAKLLESIGYPKCRQSKDICACNPHYIKDLCEKMAEFCVKYNVSYFKIDGFAITPCKSAKHGHPKGQGDGLYFYTFLWEEWTKGFERIRKVRPDVFLNVTSYAHCSPWFLKWCDAIWLNNCSDMGYAGKGDNLSQCLNYRDGRYMDFFETRQLQFPVSNLYNHEPCYAERNCNPPMTSNLQNPSSIHPTVVYDLKQFREYMYMCMMRGTGFIEMYFTPKMFDCERYKVAAEVLQWAEKNFDIIKRSRFFGKRPEDGNVYGYYAKDGNNAILAVRNSSDSPQKYVFDENLLNFGKAKISVKEFYPEDEERIEISERFEVDLKPYEIRLYYL
ncbi:MAG: alpha-galactosidase, partial [Clostridia bacterium]|nr:alpha-galactosidase [Clostridia bacterium]